jgi:plasmid stabilization system protein ParE
MARQVVWTETAWSDLQRNADHIARDSPAYAAAFVRRVRDAARSLVELSQRGRIVPELGDPLVRELLLGSYRLIYEAREKRVYVLGLVHGARDLAALWSREQREDMDLPS